MGLLLIIVTFTAMFRLFPVVTFCAGLMLTAAPVVIMVVVLVAFTVGSVIMLVWFPLRGFFCLFIPLVLFGVVATIPVSECISEQSG